MNGRAISFKLILAPFMVNEDEFLEPEFLLASVFSFSDEIWK